MWYLWEASNGKFSIVCDKREMHPWKMHESKEGERKRGQPKTTWKMQVKKESKSVDLEKKNAMN